MSVRLSHRPSVTFLNCKRFSHYNPCPTVRDRFAVYPTLFLMNAHAIERTENLVSMKLWCKIWFVFLFCFCLKQLGKLKRKTILPMKSYGNRRAIHAESLQVRKNDIKNELCCISKAHTVVLLKQYEFSRFIETTSFRYEIH